MSRYAEVHSEPQGPGDARPTALQIVKDEGMEGQLTGKVIVITGTSSGLGIETVRALSATGARFFLIARDLAKAKVALADIFDASRMELIEMDQTSLESVRTAASEILAKTDKINILVNNAGVMAIPSLELTKDGHELHFGTNHLSHFLFFGLLKPALLAASTPEFQSRVVVVASSGHLIHGLNASDNYDFQQGGYNPWVAYAQSKTANVYTANELDRRYASQGIHATSVHPGVINTPLGRHLSPEQAEAFVSDPALMKTFKSPEQGAATAVWAAIGKAWEGRGGKYLEDVTEAVLSKDETKVVGFGFARHAYNLERERRLWEDSSKLVGLN